jgi:uncharacterized protein (TIGR02147 family)
MYFLYGPALTGPLCTKTLLQNSNPYYNSHMETQATEQNILKTKDFKSLLQEELLKRCRKNPSYSLRSFAKYLGIGHSALTEMLNGKRSITKKSMEKLGLVLGLSMNELEGYKMSANCSQTEAEKQQASYQQLTIDQFAIMSDWYHYAILELIKIKDFPHTTNDFARALGITKSESNIAVERLFRIGLLEKNEEGSFVEINNGFATNISGNLSSAGSKKLQKQILEQSIDALMTLPIEVRNHTSMTMAIDPKLLPEAIEKIKKFRRELSEFLETSGTPTEVYQFSLSLFPVTQISNNLDNGEHV